MTSAWQAVSVKKDVLDDEVFEPDASAWRAWVCTSGSDMAGFSPRIYMAFDLGRPLNGVHDFNDRQAFIPDRAVPAPKLISITSARMSGDPRQT